MTVSEKILRGVLSTIYKMTDGEIDALTQSAETEIEANLTAILEKDKARISEFKTIQFQDGYKSAKKEVLTAHEKSLKAKFGIEDANLKGEELVQAIVEAKIKEVGGDNSKNTKITEDEIKKHPLYISLEQDRQKSIDKLNQDWEQKLQSKESEFKKTSVFSSVKDKALNILNGGNFAFPDDATIANNQRNFVLKDLQGYDYEEVNGTLYPIKDGKRLEDAHGNAINLDEFITAQAKQYIPIKNNAGGGNPPPNGGGAGGAGGAKFIPKNAQELHTYVTNNDVPLEDRRAVMEEFKDAF